MSLQVRCNNCGMAQYVEGNTVLSLCRRCGVTLELGEKVEWKKKLNIRRWQHAKLLYYNIEH